MAENDIYNNKVRYENFVANVDQILEPPKKKQKKKYYCKNKNNVVYFKRFFKHFDTKDLSFIRRLRVLQTFKVICHATDKYLKECEREDINKIVSFMHTVYKSPKSKSDFIKDIKYIWRTLLPENDIKGRIDDTITPYPVRHLSTKIDKSKEKLRNDRLSLKEFKKIVGFFSGEPKLQAYLMLAFESLGRPQEILYTKIKDYEFYDNFAKVWISEHGKEGCGFLQCIDSYPYIIEWFKNHPFKDNPDAFFFINQNNNGKYRQLKNEYINHRLQHACKTLGINKQISCYSLKRNGITHRRLRGDSDVQIQHAARWTSTKQLKIYDMTTQQDALEIELKKRGLVRGNEKKEEVKTKSCEFCGYENGCIEQFCANCKRPLDRAKLKEMADNHDRLMNHEMIQKFDKMERMIAKIIK
ncbi:MAG: site-specific integrase [archaeon]